MFFSHGYPEGQLVILAGPSGVGKTAVVEQLIEKVPKLFFSVSVTTRQPRDGEVPGKHYHYVTDTQFDQLIAEDGFLEWALIHNGLQRSGTPKAPIEAAIADKRPVLVEVDLVGAASIKKTLPWAQSVFLMPPNWNELKARLTGRGSETEATLARRLKMARWEMMHAKHFDRIVINYQTEKTVQEIIPLLSNVGSYEH